MMKKLNFNTVFNAFILIGMIVAVVIASTIKIRAASDGTLMLLVAAVGAIMGVVNTVLSANGRILTFVFGFFDVAIYSFALFRSGIYGTAALHVLYFLPMQFVGWFQWKKRGNDEESRVRARHLTPLGWTLSVLSLLGVVLVAYAVLNYVDSGRLVPGAFKAAVAVDAAVVGFNIIGQVLMSFAFPEQWYAWILVNVFSIAMWVGKAREGGDVYSTVYVIKYCFYLLNSLNGLRIWMSIGKKNNN